MATVIIGSARIDENGNTHGGKAGDQGKEVATQAWYRHSKGWVLLRPKYPEDAEKIAAAMQAACDNQKIGYDQYQRDTLYSAAKAFGFDPAQVATKVETDCSALVRVCCAYAGIVVSTFRTTNEASVLMATGRFEKLTASKYVKQSAYLRRGDILVTKTQGHTVVVLSDGSKAGKTYALGERTLYKGLGGPDVMQMQAHLLALEFALPKYGADGDFGSETLKAVLAFQAKAEISEDGVMDAADIAKLLDVVANGYGSAPVEAEPEPETPVTDGPVYDVRGVEPDISSNQGKLDLDKLAAGNDFAIFRVVRGNGLIDPQAVRNMSGCYDRGFPFHVYHFFKPYSAADAENLAATMFAACDKYKPVVYWLDVETLYPGRTHAQMRGYIKAYVAKMREFGVKKIGLYMGQSRFNNWYWKIADLFDALWIAHYGLNTGYLSNIPILLHGYKAALHQYTSMGGARINGKKVPGAPGVSVRVDLNRLTGVKPLSWFTGRNHTGVEYPGIVRATGNVNVRQGPGTNYKAIDTIPKGRYATLRGLPTEGWQAVSYNGQDGFVSAQHIETVEES